MYRFIIKILSNSSTEHNVCTHTHPHGHARKCCQITLVHTHGHTRGATLVLTVQPGHAQAHLGTLYIRRAGEAAELQRNARTAPSSFHPHAPQKVGGEVDKIFYHGHRLKTYQCVQESSRNAVSRLTWAKTVLYRF